MRLTIIKSDNIVCVDKEGMVVDCSDLPADFHALQWDGKSGWIEYGDQNTPHEPINSIKAYKKYVDAWIVERDKKFALEQELLAKKNNNNK